MNNKARIITKHDTTANWNAAVDFIPMKGEVIIYDDYQTEPGWEDIYNPFDNPLEQGAIASATGQDTSNLTRVRTNGYIEVEPSTEYTISADIYQVFILEYGTHNQYLNIYDGWKPMPCTFTTAASCKSIRLVFANSTNTVITKEEITWARVVHQVDVPTPNIKVGDGVRPAPDLPFIYSEVDPTVPNWAKQATKPEYDASEISFEPIDPNPILVDTGDVQKAISNVGDYAYFMTPATIGAVPTSRKVNGHALTSDVNVTAADVGAVPTSRKVNGHALTSDVNLAFSDLGGSIDARDVDYTPPSGSIYGQADNVDRALEAVDTYLEDLSAGGVAYEPSSPSTSVFGQATDVERALDNLDTYMAGHPIPDATSEPDGAALVAVDGVWTKQTGYGYYKPEPTDEVYTFIKTTTAFQPTLLTFGVSLTEGEPYRVEYDGDIYDLECITRVVTFQGTTVTVQMVGNAQLIGSTGGDPNCPFVLVSTLMPDPDEGTTIVTWDIIITSTSGVHQGKLLKYQPTAHPIDNSYINITSSQVTDALGYTPASTSNLTAFMRKGVDYVTAGRKSGTTEGVYSTAEGYNNTASGNYSHAEGYSTFALYYHTHAEGQYSIAEGLNSHAEGSYTVAHRKSQHVFGECNISETGDKSTRGTYVEIVGNGTDANNRSNARTLDWSGNEVLAGTLTVGADPTANMQVATKQYVDNSMVTPPVTSVNGRTGDVTGLAEASDLSNYLDKRTGGTINGAITVSGGNINMTGGNVMVNGGDVYLLASQGGTSSQELYLISSVNGVTGSWRVYKQNHKLYFATASSGADVKVVFDNDGTIQAKTQDATDNSTKVATTAFVKSVLPTVPTNVNTFTNDAGYLVSSDLVAITTAEIDALFV